MCTTSNLPKLSFKKWTSQWFQKLDSLNPIFSLSYVLMTVSWDPTSREKAKVTVRMSGKKKKKKNEWDMIVRCLTSSPVAQRQRICVQCRRYGDMGSTP